MGGGDTEIDAIRATKDVDKRQQCNRGRQGGNGRVDVEVVVVKPPEPRHG